MYERSHQGMGGEDPGSRGADRAVWLGVTFGAAGRPAGDLTPGCSATLSAVLDALAKRAGPEDIRTAAQRRHDAPEEAARRLIAGGMLPGRTGQRAQIQVHMSLSQLRSTSGVSTAENAWMTARTAQFGWPTGSKAGAAACDATIVPVVTGHVDSYALDRLTDVYLATGDPDPMCDPDPAQPRAARSRPAQPGRLEPACQRGPGRPRPTHAAGGVKAAVVQPPVPRGG